jgi:hypothetical protein
VAVIFLGIASSCVLQDSGPGRGDFLGVGWIFIAICLLAIALLLGHLFRSDK